MFSWNDYIKVSKSLQKYAKINSTVSEGFFRSGVSRAYYAAYHAALSYAHSKGFNKVTYRVYLSRMGIRDLGEHSLLIRYLSDYSDPNVKLLGTTLKNCRDRRVECDYKPAISVDDRYTLISLMETDSIHSLISTLP